MLEVMIKKNLDGFSMDAAWSASNEIIAIFGYSGAGKSLTLKMIAGLMRPDKGRIMLNDEVLFDDSLCIDQKPQDRGVGYVFQDSALFPHMTVRENIAYGISGGIKLNVINLMVEEMLARFNLTGLSAKYPREISGGQKQRVAFSRALIGRPRLLLLDEPFSALDNHIRNDMRRMLLDVKRAYDIPVVIVTHDLREACMLADRMVVYSNGRIAQTGAPNSILSNPADASVERLVGVDHPRIATKSYQYN